MRNKKRRRKYGGKMSVIYISIIVSLGAMGVGYAAWGEGLKIGMNITTGHLDIESKITDGLTQIKNYEEFNINTNSKTLEIVGKVYPGFSHSLEMEIYDKGSIPSVLNDIKPISDDKEVVKIVKTTSSERDDLLESFCISINPEISDSGDYDNSFIDKSPDDLEGEIEGLSNKINRLEDKLNEYMSIHERFIFDYKILFEQGL